jgi:hypothetical protein
VRNAEVGIRNERQSQELRLKGGIKNRPPNFVIPAKAGIQRFYLLSFHSGFLLESIPMEIGAGMTTQREYKTGS